MARRCDCCCPNLGNCIRLTVITSPCACLPAGTQLILYRRSDDVCKVFSTDHASFLCDGVPVEAGLTCCRTGCLDSEWVMPPTSKVWIQGGTLRDDWTCEPFFQHWTGVTYSGNVACDGVPFDIEFDDVC